MLALSVVLILRDRFDGVARTIRHLQAQTIAEQLEIILVTRSTREAALDERALACFGAWRSIELPELTRGGAGRAAGVLHATAPFVAFAEDHCFPEPDWAEALLEEFHRHPEAGAIVPSIVNGNPSTLTSWADVYMNFGPYVDYTGSRALDHLPWHNGCFRREAFAGYEADLPHFLEVEMLWHDRLLEDGYTLRITPATRIHHHNFSRLRFFLREQYVNGRILSSVQAESMSLWSRWLHASSAPLVQTHRFRRILRDLRRSERLGLLPRLLPALTLGLAANGSGEFVGFIFGTGRAMEAKFDFEFRRHRFMTEADGRDLLDPDHSVDANRGLSQMPSDIPLLSVILVTPDTYATVRDTVRHLARQTVRDRLELVLVGPSDELGLMATDMAGFHSHQVVVTGPIRSSSRARVEGVRRSKAPVIAFAEDHAFPDPDWAEALLLAHEGPWAAVGPVVRNANPNTIISWADLLIGYGPWVEPHPGGVVDSLPGHNSSYKRDRLLAYGPELEDMLDAETVMHWDLRAGGERLYLEPAARLAHMNYAMPGIWMHAQFHNGRLFAAQRLRGAPRWKRLFFVAASPLIPVVRLVRTVRATTRLRHWSLLVRVTPVLFLGLLVDGLGQLVGYATGAGSAMRKLVDIEFHRVRYARLEH